VPSPTWLDDVRRLLDHVAASDATEVEYSEEGFRIKLTRRPGSQYAIATTSSDERPVDSNLVQIVAPLTGVFYRASSHGAPPLVSEGDEVRPDTVVGLIETMKIFNEVTAECRGRIHRIVAESGQLAHSGDCLMLVEPSADGAADRVES
jgi:acetyl-CoA carboxylase biotin carboxyl carrier protein